MTLTDRAKYFLGYIVLGGMIPWATGAFFFYLLFYPLQMLISISLPRFILAMAVVGSFLGAFLGIVGLAPNKSEIPDPLEKPHAYILYMKSAVATLIILSFFVIFQLFLSTTDLECLNNNFLCCIICIMQTLIINVSVVPVEHLAKWHLKQLEFVQTQLKAIENEKTD